jgi:hypothetical protein
METRNRCQGINSASLCSLAGRYDNPIPPRCLAPIDFLKIPAQEWQPKHGHQQWWKLQEHNGCQQQQFQYPNNRRKANNSMYAKIEETQATVGTPTAEGTTTSMITPGTEGMSTTAGPQQQQKRQPQHECEARQHQKGRQ